MTFQEYAQNNNLSYVALTIVTDGIKKDSNLLLTVLAEFNDGKANILTKTWPGGSPTNTVEFTGLTEEVYENLLSLEEDISYEEQMNQFLEYINSFDLVIGYNRKFIERLLPKISNFIDIGTLYKLDFSAIIPGEDPTQALLSAATIKTAIERSDSWIHVSNQYPLPDESSDESRPTWLQNMYKLANVIQIS